MNLTHVVRVMPITDATLVPKDWLSSILLYLTNQDVKYILDDAGSRCPVCGSENTEGDEKEWEGDEAYSKTECQDCHATWKEIYHLVGITDVKPVDTTTIR